MTEHENIIFAREYCQKRGFRYRIMKPATLAIDGGCIAYDLRILSKEDIRLLVDMYFEYKYLK